MKKFWNAIGSLKTLAIFTAAFAGAFSFLAAADTELFFSQYAAGMAGGVALGLWIDD